MILLFTLLRDEEVEAAAKVLKSGWIGLRPKAEFEKQFASYIGVPSPVGLPPALWRYHYPD